MSQRWQQQRVPIKFKLGEKTLFAKELRLNVREVDFTTDHDAIAATPQPPAQPLPPGCEGYLIRSLPVEGEQPRWRLAGNYICYVSSQYQRYYIDLQQSFDDYRQKFSSKSRSTINRKIKKFSARFGGEIRWKIYSSVNEIQEFYRLARAVSSKTYQERLLDAGLPDSADFQTEIELLASQDTARGYILFDAERPIAFLFCPIRNEVVLYQYLGYDPDYVDWSVGTVLQWHALESIFNEGRFTLFDFTEGQSDHKRFFSTGSVQCANVYFLRNRIANRLLVRAHMGMDALSRKAGDALHRIGLKTAIKKLVRFGVRRPGKSVSYIPPVSGSAERRAR